MAEKKIKHKKITDKRQMTKAEIDFIKYFGSVLPSFTKGLKEIRIAEMSLKKAWLTKTKKRA